MIMAEVNDVAGDLLVAIGLLNRRLQQLPASERGEFTPSEMAALLRLERSGAQTGADLARAERVSPQSMSATINALEAKGLIARDADPADGRRILLSLTRVGLAAAGQRRAARRQHLGAILAGCTDVELETLAEAARLMEQLADVL